MHGNPDVHKHTHTELSEGDGLAPESGSVTLSIRVGPGVNVRLVID